MAHEVYIQSVKMTSPCSGTRVASKIIVAVVFNGAGRWPQCYCSVCIVISLGRSTWCTLVYF